MVHVHYNGGGRYRTSGVTFEEDDVVDVDDVLADSLCEKDAFARVDAEDAADEDEPEESPDGFDADAWIDEHHYQAREEQVRAGDVDDHLDAIEAAETSTTVEEAVAERRVELEG